MERKIEIVKAAPEHYTRIREIMIKAWTPIREAAVKRLGSEIAGKPNWDHQFSVIKERIEDDCGLVALVDGNVAGFATYRDIPGIPLMGQIGYNAVDTDFKGMGLGTKMYKIILDKMREKGKKYARVHTDLDDNHAPARRSYEKAGFDRGTPEITYYMELDKRPELKVNKDIKIVPATEEHIEEVKKITIAAWTPIHKVRKEILGEEIYNLTSKGWEEAKCESVIKALLSYDEQYKGYVALLDDKVAGFVTYRVIKGNPDIGRMGNNAVSPEFTGKGIGSTMYKFVLDEMENIGLKYASVYTGLDEAHAPARRAYEKAGYNPETSTKTIEYYMHL